MNHQYLALLGLFAGILALLVEPPAAADEPISRVDASVSREAKVEGLRVILLSAGYETVFTGDADAKKAAVRRLNVTLVLEPLGKPPKGPALGLGPIQYFSAGTETPVKEAPLSTQVGKSSRYKGYDVRHFLMPKVADEEHTLIFEQSFGPVVAEPERIDLRLKVRNGEQGGTCEFKNIRLK
jgi:hypothetical protein